MKNGRFWADLRGVGGEGAFGKVGAGGDAVGMENGGSKLLASLRHCCIAHAPIIYT